MVLYIWAHEVSSKIIQLKSNLFSPTAIIHSNISSSLCELSETRAISKTLVTGPWTDCKQNKLKLYFNFQLFVIINNIKNLTSASYQVEAD